MRDVLGLHVALSEVWISAIRMEWVEVKASLRFGVGVWLVEVRLRNRRVFTIGLWLVTTCLELSLVEVVWSVVKDKAVVVAIW